MIATVRGEVQSMSAEHVVIEAHGVGYLVLTTPQTLSRLQIGHEAFLHTAFVVREESMTLFGFGSIDERQVFEVLTSVSGIGPKIALAILSVLRPDELRRAISHKDEATISRVPGIGKKSAQRLILEIGEKLGPVVGETLSTGEGVPMDSDVLEALISLGWRESEAAEAISQARVASPDLPTSELLRATLQLLGSRR